MTCIPLKNYEVFDSLTSILIVPNVFRKQFAFALNIIMIGTVIWERAYQIDFLKIVSKFCCRELYLDGNNLECKGLVNLISLCAEQAFYESTMRAEEAAKKLQEEAEKAERGLY